MITATELTERGTSRTVRAGDLDVHYHDIGTGEPIVFLHSYGPGTTAWITFSKVVEAFAESYRCILVDLPNFGRTGPMRFDEPGHVAYARIVRDLMDALEVPRATLIGNSVGGTTAVVFALAYPDRVDKLIIGACHASTGGDPYTIANFPSEGVRAFFDAINDPTRDNIRRYLRVHIDDEALVTEDLIDYIFENHTSHLDHFEALMSSSHETHSNLQDLPNITAPTLIVHGRFDRMISIETALAILGYLPDSRLVVLNKCGHWPPYEKPEEYTRYALAFLQGEGADASKRAVIPGME